MCRGLVGGKFVLGGCCTGRRLGRRRLFVWYWLAWDWVRERGGRTAHAGDVVEELDTGFRSWVGFYEGEVDADEVKDRVHC